MYTHHIRSKYILQKKVELIIKERKQKMFEKKVALLKYSASNKLLSKLRENVFSSTDYYTKEGE